MAFCCVNRHVQNIERSEKNCLEGEVDSTGVRKSLYKPLFDLFEHNYTIFSLLNSRFVLSCFVEIKFCNNSMMPCVALSWDDSFVVETNVHDPTDINLLFDVMRKVISLVATLCILFNIDGWRQSKHNIKTVKRLFRKAQQLERSTSKDPKKKAKREELIKAAHQEYIDVANTFLE